VQGDKYHKGVPSDRHMKTRAGGRAFRDPELGRLAAIAAVLGAVMLADDLSADSVAPIGIDLVLGRRGSFTRGGPAAPSSTTIAPTNLITGVTTANPGVVTTTSAHGLATGQLVAIGGVSGATQANGVWVVTVLSPTTFSIPVNVTGTFSGSGGTFVPAFAGVEASGHGTLRLDLAMSAHSGTGTPTLTASIWTSYDNGVTDPWRQVDSTMTGVTANGTTRQVFRGLDRWVTLAAAVTGTTPSVTFTASGELV
jgi:hypothetical protein